LFNDIVIYRHRKQKQCTPVQIEITWPHLERFSRQASITSRNVQLHNTDNLPSPQDISLQEKQVVMSTSFIEEPLNMQTVNPLHITGPRHYKYEVSPDGDSLQTFQSVASTSTATHFPPVPYNSVQSSPQPTRRILTRANHLHLTASETNSVQSSPQLQTTQKVLNSTATYHQHVPVYTTNSAQFSPQTTKKLVNVTDHTNAKTKKTCTDGTETSNSWEVEKFEDSVAYKAKAKEMWKQAQKYPLKFQALL